MPEWLRRGFGIIIESGCFFLSLGSTSLSFLIASSFFYLLCLSTSILFFVNALTKFLSKLSPVINASYLCSAVISFLWSRIWFKFFILAKSSLSFSAFQVMIASSVHFSRLITRLLCSSDFAYLKMIARKAVQVSRKSRLNSIGLYSLLLLIDWGWMAHGKMLKASSEFLGRSISCSSDSQPAALAAASSYILSLR